MNAAGKLHAKAHDAAAHTTGKLVHARSRLGFGGRRRVGPFLLIGPKRSAQASLVAREHSDCIKTICKATHPADRKIGEIEHLKTKKNPYQTICYEFYIGGSLKEPSGCAAKPFID